MADAPRSRYDVKELCGDVIALLAAVEIWAKLFIQKETVETVDAAVNRHLQFA